MKTCWTCKTSLSLDSFTKDSRSKDGLKGGCKSCRSDDMKRYRSLRPDHFREKSKTWTRKNPDKVRNCSYKRKHGITLEDFNVMVKQQEGLCLLCCKTPKGRLVVDHNHLTGKIRGLLCRSCNGALGVLGDDVESLKNALKYLSKGE